MRALALDVLRNNWTGGYTLPSRRLYPHQWSWDSAFHALGWGVVEPARARDEMAAVFGMQWSDGRIPQIAFDPATADDAYFPGPPFWRRSGSVRDGRLTSCLVQPPVHAAIAARLPIDRAWARRAYQYLAAWHDYLFDRRVRPGRRLVSIVHPWESGMDDSPVWDGPLSAVQRREPRTTYVRRDLQHGSGDPGDRPTDAEYARYVVLAEDYRDLGADDDRLGEHQFLVECPLFNASLAWSEQGLADLATQAGFDPGLHRRRAAQLTAALVADLWDDERGTFGAYDGCAGAHVENPTISGLVPVLTALPGELVERVIGTAVKCFGLGGDGVQLPTVAPGSTEFDPGRYWRGPAWLNTNWFVVQGLRRHGRTALAEGLAAHSLDLVRRAGAREYFHAIDGRGLGTDGFGWTAAVTLDLLSGLTPTPGSAG